MDNMSCFHPADDSNTAPGAAFGQNKFDLLEYSMGAAAAAVNELEAWDEDIAPLLHTYGDGGRGGVEVAEFLADATPDRLFQTVASVMRLAESRECTYTDMAWIAPIASCTSHSGQPPELKEKVIVSHRGRGWHKIYAALVVRNPDGTADLGRWHHFDGIFVEPFGDFLAACLQQQNSDAQSRQMAQGRRRSNAKLRRAPLPCSLAFLKSSGDEGEVRR